MTETRTENPLVNRLLRLNPDKDRAILAALRSGLGKSPGQAPRMLPFVAAFTSPSSGRVEFASAFFVASLFAMNPRHEVGRSLGLALWHATKFENNPKGIHSPPGVESRFVLALDSHPDDFPRNLEGLVRLCESANQGLDWYRLHSDLRAFLGTNEKWRDDVRMIWARDFWQGPRNFADNQEPK